MSGPLNRPEITKRRDRESQDSEPKTQTEQTEAGSSKKKAKKEDVAHPSRLEFLLSKESRPTHVGNPQRLTSIGWAVIVDWIVHAASRQSLSSDVIYRTIDCFHRFLSSGDINCDRHWLVGAACIVLASELEGSSVAVHVENFRLLVRNDFTVEEVMDMKSIVRKALKDDDINRPTVKSFVRTFASAAAQWGNAYMKEKFTFLCNYLAELTLLDYGCLEFLPSQIAAAAIFVTRVTLFPESHPWSPTLRLRLSTSYSAAQLKPIIDIIHKLQLGRREAAANLKYNIIKRKYKDTMFHNVANLMPPSDIPARCFEE